MTCYKSTTYPCAISCINDELAPLRRRIGGRTCRNSIEHIPWVVVGGLPNLCLHLADIQYHIFRLVSEVRLCCEDEGCSWRTWLYADLRSYIVRLARVLLNDSSRSMVEDVAGGDGKGGEGCWQGSTCGSRDHCLFRAHHSLRPPRMRPTSILLKSGRSAWKGEHGTYPISSYLTAKQGRTLYRFLTSGRH